jgi:DUF917 family protein
MNIPVVDGDYMGRAYPVAWQVTPVVWDPEGDRNALFLPTSITDGNGNSLVRLVLMTYLSFQLKVYAVNDIL